MKKLLKNLFALPTRTSSENAAPIQLEMATCVLLLEAARADNDFTYEEWQHIIEVVRIRFNLSYEEAEALIEEARITRDESVDLWHFTHVINERCTVAEKIAIIEEIWRIIYADAILDGHEDRLAHKLQELLNLNHKQLMDAKMRARGKI